MKGMRCTVLWFVLLLLAGCGTVPEAIGPEAESRWQARQVALNALQNWEFEGRIAIQREAEGWFAGLHWAQHGAAYQLKVTGPAGQGMARLEGDAAGVTLTRSDRTVYQAHTPEELLSTHLGWKVPVTGLHDWIRGLPGPSPATAQRLDAAGHLVQLHQDAWDIRFDRYVTVDTLELPGRVVLECPTLSVRIIVDRWYPPPRKASGS